LGDWSPQNVTANSQLTPRSREMQSAAGEPQRDARSSSGAGGLSRRTRIRCGVPGTQFTANRNKSFSKFGLLSSNLIATLSTVGLLAHASQHPDETEFALRPQDTPSWCTEDWLNTELKSAFFRLSFPNPRTWRIEKRNGRPGGDYSLLRVSLGSSPKNRRYASRARAMAPKSPVLGQPP
jgi:hypothetical protein